MIRVLHCGFLGGITSLSSSINLSHSPTTGLAYFTAEKSSANRDIGKGLLMGTTEALEDNQPPRKRLKAVRKDADGNRILSAPKGNVSSIQTL